MSYDYSSESRQLELPNPYRVQNAIMVWGAALLRSEEHTSELQSRLHLV